MSLVIIGSILTIMDHTILNICVLVAVTIVLTWKIYGRVCIKFGLLVLCIYQNLYHTIDTNTFRDWSHPINFTIYVALPSLAAVHIIIFDVKECIVIMVYSLIICLTPHYVKRSIFGQYYYQYHTSKRDIEKCAVCWISFDVINTNDSNQQVILPACYHAFCEQCINRWEHGKKAPTCPVCRQHNYLIHEGKPKVRLDFNVAIKKGYLSLYVDWNKYK
eukprot:307386_1